MLIRVNLRLILIRTLLTVGLPILFMQLANAAGITWWRHAKERITTGRQPVIKDGSEFREWPHPHNRRQPLPARQYADEFDPGKVSLRPTPVRCARVHLVSHLFARMRRGARENFRLIVIKPFNAVIAIQWLDMFAHPAAQIAMAVGVDFNCVFGCHSFRSRPLTSYSRLVRNDTITHIYEETLRRCKGSRTD